METVTVKLSDPTKIFTDISQGGEDGLVIIGDQEVKVEYNFAVSNAIREQRLKMIGGINKSDQLEGQSFPEDQETIEQRVNGKK